MFHGKCSRRPFTVSGQKGTEQRSCHLFSLKFETLLYSRVRVSSTKKREKCLSRVETPAGKRQMREMQVT